MKALLLSILLSILPISELRGGIPLALSQGMPILEAFFICTTANIIVIWPIFLFFDHLHKYFLRLNFYKRTFNLFLKRVRRDEGKIRKRLRRYGFFALMIYVAVPWPLTGAWTGTLIAWFFDLERWKSFVAIALGVIVAGIIVTLVTAGIITFFGL